MTSTVSSTKPEDTFSSRVHPHPFPKSSWNPSHDLSHRIQEQVRKEIGKPFVACPILPSDPEGDFVMDYFLKNPPRGLGIRSIEYIHNALQIKAFELAILNMHEGAKTFPASWREEEPKAIREEAMKRWRRQVEKFNPPVVSSPDQTVCTGAYVLPVWHGTRYDRIQSIFTNGFVDFGKHHFYDSSIKAGTHESTDEGWFGSGIYFTNASRYAEMYSDKTLIMAYIAHREPFPVVNDIPILNKGKPQKGRDMRMLEGRGHYKAYNCHYVPVKRIDVKDPDCAVCYSCFHEEPDWDEFCIFNSNQALPRFVIRLGSYSPFSITSASLSVQTLKAMLLELLQDTQVQQDKDLVTSLSKRLKALGLILDQNSALLEQDQEFYQWIERFLFSTQKVTSFAKQHITPTTESVSTEQIEHKTPLPHTNALHGSSLELSKKELDGKMVFAGLSSTTSFKPLEKTEQVLSPDPALVDKEGFNSLHRATKVGDIAAVRFILFTHRHLIETRTITPSSNTPLMIAAYYPKNAS